MSSEGGLPIDDPEDVTKGQMLEILKGQQARIEKLEEEVDQVREDERKDVTNNVFNQILGALVGPEAIDFVADPMQNRDAIQDFGARVREIENTVDRHSQLEDKLDKGKASGPEEAWLNIVTAAENLQSDQDHALPNNRVQLFVDNITEYTGKSKDQAGRYIEWFGKDDGKYKKPGTTYKPYKPPSAFNKGKAQRKAIVVDLDVWGDDDE